MSQRSQSSSAQDKSNTIIEERNSKGELLQTYIKGRFLGKGGFAKCYEFTQINSKKIYAAKVICKASLNKSRAKQKLMSEIKIHKSLKHTNIVNFEHFFEDSENVYILLEICTNETLAELVRRRKRLTELEAQCYTLQILNAIKHLHNHRVIHRDLKLGNLFLSEKMEIKLGDFGLASKLDFDGEKKRTICGTPNYIAPEILEGKQGHSYEVDVWSLGVILYTFIIGRPPFETSDVKATYKRIKMNSYSFPDTVQISSQARNLITKILVTDPSKRPTIDQILNSEFFTGNPVPKLLPSSTLACPPSSSYVKQFIPQNKEKDTLSYRSSSPQRFEGTMPASAGLKPTLNERKDFMNTERVTKTSTSSTNFMPSPHLNHHVNSGNLKMDMLTIGKISHSDKPAPTSTKHQFNLNTMQDQGRSSRDRDDFIGSRKASEQNEDNFFIPNGLRQKSPSVRGSSKNLTTHQTHHGSQITTTTYVGGVGSAAGPDVWVKRWVDYSSKYGLGYLLSNGCFGVFFNDSSKVLLEAKSGKLIYVERKGPQKQDVANEYTLTDYPKDLQKKVTLLQHFKSHLENEESKHKQDISKEVSEVGIDLKGMIPIYVKKWIKTKHALMFRLSSKVVQVVFQDQTEIVLSSELKIVTYVNKKHERLHYPLATALQSSNNEMTKRLKYTKDILTHMLGGGNIIPNPIIGDENKKSHHVTSQKITRSSSTMAKDEFLMNSGEYTGKRADSVMSGFDGKGSTRLGQTGRSSLHNTGSAALLERGL